MKTFNPHNWSLALVTLLLLGSCAGLPSSPVPLGAPARVIYRQPPTKSGRSLAMRLINRATVKGARPQDQGTKITADREMDNLLRCFQAADYFSVAQKVGGKSAGPCFIRVETDQGNWSLPRPSIHGGQGRKPGESLTSASDRFNNCMIIFNEFFNRTFDLVPVKVRDGHRHFYNQQKSLRDRNQEKRAGKTK